MEKREMLENAIYALEDAIEAIRRIGKNYEPDAECIDEIRRSLKVELEEIKAEIAVAQKKEEAALEREYWSAVL